MSDINSAVNNLADRLGEAISPAIENVSEISRTLVQETSAIGFTYTMIGCGIICAGCISAIGIALALRYINSNRRREGVVSGLIIATGILVGTGFPLAMINLKDWVSPTRQIVREIVTNIQN